MYELQYVSAEGMAQLLNEVSRFAPNSPAAQSGGVRQGDKFLQPMMFQAEPAGNRLLIRAEKEDYLKVRDIIKELDVKQPQIALEVLVVNVVSSEDKELGVQFRNKDTDTISKRLDFQASGFPLSAGAKASPVVDPNTGSIVANLITLAQNQSAGATLLSISNAANGVWGIFKILQSVAHTNVIANPFLITTNKYQAQVSLGETRRVQTAQVVGVQTANALGDVSASLTVKIVPQINSLGIINLDISIDIDTFVDATNPISADKNVKIIRTNTSVANKEVLAIGGLLKTNVDEEIVGVPILQDIPIIGWLFKNKSKSIAKDNLLVFISPRIIEPLETGGMTKRTELKIGQAQTDLRDMHVPSEKRDPIHRWFFNDRISEGARDIRHFVNQTHPLESIPVPASMECPTNCISGDLQINPQTNEPERICPAQPAGIYAPNGSYKKQVDEYAQCTPVITCNAQHGAKKRSLVDVFPEHEGVCS